MEAIVLAGGLGTRLRSVVSNVPKPMAPIGGKPFLSYIMEYLGREGISKVILSTGYLHKQIETFFHNNYQGIEIEYVIENEPLGTGGAIKNAISKIKYDSVVVLNGDSYFDINLKTLRATHQTLNADVTFSLKPLTNYDRYGTVSTYKDKIIGFSKQGFRKYGKVNGGVYLIRTDLFSGFELPAQFSFEDFLEKHVDELKLGGLVSNSYFIDIGVPEDYQKAQEELGYNRE